MFSFSSRRSMEDAFQHKIIGVERTHMPAQFTLKTFFFNSHCSNILASFARVIKDAALPSFLLYFANPQSIVNGSAMRHPLIHTHTHAHNHLLRKTLQKCNKKERRVSFEQCVQRVLWEFDVWSSSRCPFTFFKKKQIQETKTRVQEAVSVYFIAVYEAAAAVSFSCQ